MNPSLRPIKRLITISFALHIIGLCVAAMFFIFQRPLRPVIIITGGVGLLRAEESVYPPLLLIVIIFMIFALHCSLTIAFLRTINRRSNPAEQLHLLSFLSFFVVFLLVPVLTSGFVETVLFLFATRGVDEFIAMDYRIAVSGILSFGLRIRSLAMSILLIAASMSWYSYFINKATPPSH